MIMEIPNDLREFIAACVRQGFESVHEVVDNAKIYAYERLGRDDLTSDIQRLTAELLIAHRAEQAGWENTTDCDRLDQAFAALEQRGIVARQNFSCCNHCGFTEIWNEVDETEKSRPVDGYAFYSIQSTKHVIETGQLLMAYGCIEEEADALQRVAELVVEELRRVDLSASWGGTASHPILVSDLVWCRRRDWP